MINNDERCQTKTYSRSTGNLPKSIERRKKIEIKNIIELILKVMAMSMAIVSIVMGFFPREINVKTHIPLLSIGLAALAIAALQ